MAVKGSGPREVELRFTVHGPIIYEDRAHQRAYALRWVGSEAGRRGISADADGFAGEELARVSRRAGAPEGAGGKYGLRGHGGKHRLRGQPALRRCARTGRDCCRCPATGEFEWSGLLPADQLPASYNPAKHFLASANNNILPPGYGKVLTYEWGPPFRIQRIEELLGPAKKFGVSDFEAMQRDVLSIPARRFQAVVRRWKGASASQAAAVQRVLNWDARLGAESVPALIYEMWLSKMAGALGEAADLELLLKKIESADGLKVLGRTLDDCLSELTRYLGPNMENWQWSRSNQVTFHHPLNNQLGSRADCAAGRSEYDQRFGWGTGATERGVVPAGDRPG